MANQSAFNNIFLGKAGIRPAFPFFFGKCGSKTEQILVVSLSNIGDVILTFPVLDVLHASFPSAKVMVIVGPKAAGLLTGIPWVEVIPYDKKMPWQGKWDWFWFMRSKRFDLIVDLRNSMLPFLLNAGTVTFPSLRPSKVHMKQKHLKRLKLVLNDLPFDVPRSCVPSQKGMNIDRWLSGMKDYVVVAPGAADQRKRWGEEGFLQVVVHILRRGRKVVLVGDQQDALVAARIVASAGKGVVDLCGKTNLAELAAVVGRASFAVTNDSGIMHLLSYANKPVLALFGPTDPFFYGPWSDRSLVIRHDADMASISVEEVLRKVDGLL